MKVRRIVKKQLATLPAKFILGCIGRGTELFPQPSLLLLKAVTEKIGDIEEVLLTQDFPNPPDSYSDEMSEDYLATTIILLKTGGAYTDLHHLKKEALDIEGSLLNESGRRMFNINPGALGTYGLCLSSHKPTGGRPEVSVYAYGLHSHLFFGGDSYYERIMRWTGTNLELIGRAKSERAFSEYGLPDRVSRFEEVVRTLPKNSVPVELI